MTHLKKVLTALSSMQELTDARDWLGIIVSEKEKVCLALFSWTPIDRWLCVSRQQKGRLFFATVQLLQQLPLFLSKLLD